MARFLRLRLSPIHRKVITIIALMITLHLFIASEYTLPRNTALSLEDVYDPPLPIAEALEGSLISATPATNATSPRILLVSALFPLPPYANRSSESKGGSTSSSKTLERYLTFHLPRFLGRITTDIYFYTTPELLNAVRSTRGAGLHMTVDTSFRSAFDVPPLKGRELVYRNMFKHQVDSSRTGRRGDSPEEYAMWNAKAFFLEQAVRSLRDRKGRGMGMRKEYDYVFWADADTIREEHGYSSWPDPKRVERLWEEGGALTSRRKEEIVFFPMVDPPERQNVKGWNEGLGPIDGPFIEGSFYGGPPESILWFSKKFYAYHDYFLTLGFFAGNDDTIYNALMLLFPSRFITVWASDPSAPARGGMPPRFMAHGALGACGARSERYYYQWWLSDRKTRQDIRTWWMDHDSAVGEGGVDHGRWSWKMKIPCRLTRVLGVEGVLRRALGEKWRPPMATVLKSSRI